MQAYLRRPRYFELAYRPTGVSCWKCGRRGHSFNNCTFQREKPCALCAQYGHALSACPQREWCCAVLCAAGHSPMACTLCLSMLFLTELFVGIWSGWQRHMAPGHMADGGVTTCREWRWQ
jgi:hypothetical protein